MPDRRTVIRTGAAAVAATALGGTGFAGLAGARDLGRKAAGPDWSALRRNLSGDLLLPTDADYDRARHLAIGQFDSIRPQGVVYVDNATDVRTCLAFAKDNGLRPTPRSGGHSFGGYSTSDGLVLNLSRLNSVRPKSDTIVVGTATQQVDALAALPSGMSLAGGLCPGVCPGGFVQGGGLGWATRKYGMACDTLVSANVVLADGRHVRASEKEHPDLFWALRGGGGGNFGVVTSFELRSTGVKSMVNFNLTWPAEAAPKVLAAWQEWATQAPRDLGSATGVETYDAGSGDVKVLVYGAWLGKADKLAPLLNSLYTKVGSKPATEAVKEQSFYDSMMAWYGCSEMTVAECHTVGYNPEAKIPRFNFALDRNRMLGRPVGPSAVDELLEAFYANGRAGQYRYFSMFALGGAANDVSRTATAYVHRTTQIYTGYTFGLFEPGQSAEDEQAGHAWIDASFKTLERHALKESYQNFIDPDLTDWKSAYYGENYARLARVKRAYDPDGLFSFKQGIA